MTAQPPADFEVLPHSFRTENIICCLNFFDVAKDT